MVALASCSANRVQVEPPTASAPPGLYEVESGDVVTKDALWEVAANARFVLVAESHDNAADHAIQLEALQAIDARTNVALGMEMFQRPFQEPLDRFVAGDLDEAGMLEATEWEERWGFATDLYRPLWSYAAENNVPILALNARRELTKRISKVGIEGLTDQERAVLPEIDRSGTRYRAWMREIFRSHGAEMDDKAFENFYLAQITWDETMADTAVRWAEENPEATVVIVVGRGHVERDWGIPSRIRRRVGAQRGDGTVVSIVPVDAEKVPRFGWMRREAFADYAWVKP